MAEYIDREPLLKQIQNVYCTKCDEYNGAECKVCGIYAAIGTIKETPTVDAVPVAHGRWECGKPCPCCGEDRFKGLDADIWADSAHMEKGKAMSEWISIKDRLPEKSETYLVYAPTYCGGTSSALDNVRGVMFARWRKHWSIEVGYYKRPGCVTHWMPLPKPPEENK